MKRKFLPIGRQSFRDLREENCIYVDKTESIYHFSLRVKCIFFQGQAVSENHCYFLPLKGYFLYYNKEPFL